MVDVYDSPRGSILYPSVKMDYMTNKITNLERGPIYKISQETYIPNPRKMRKTVLLHLAAQGEPVTMARFGCYVESQLFVPVLLCTATLWMIHHLPYMPATESIVYIYRKLLKWVYFEETKKERERGVFVVCISTKTLSKPKFLLQNILKLHAQVVVDSV